VNSQDEGCRHKGSHGYRWVAAFQPPQRIAGDEKATGHVARRDPAFAPGEREVSPQFAQHMDHRQWSGNRIFHGDSVCYIRRYVN
jgi:hypothetical protein